MPLTVAHVDADFGSGGPNRPAAKHYNSAYKIAWEAPRFWEKESNIFGGISYLQQTVDLVWYPSARIFSDTGIVIGGYSIEQPPALGALPEELAKSNRLSISNCKWIRLSRRCPTCRPNSMPSRRSVICCIAGHGKDLAETISISWGHIPHNLGSWISLEWNDQKALATLAIARPPRLLRRRPHQPTLSDGRQGAALSAHRVINQLGSRIQAAG